MDKYYDIRFILLYYLINSYKFIFYIIKIMDIQDYEPFKTPPDFKLAKNHGKANLVFDNDKFLLN